MNRRATGYAGIAVVALLLCAAVLVWSARRSDMERHRMVRQQTSYALALSGVFAQVVNERLADSGFLNDGRSGDLVFSSQCPLCIEVGSPTEPHVVDLTPQLTAMARSAPDAVVALLSHDGRMEGLRSDGDAYDGMLLKSDPARLSWRMEALNSLDLDGVQRAVATAPAGGDLRVVLGLDLSSRMSSIEHRQEQDRLWAAATCVLLVGLAAATAIGIERTSRRRAMLVGERIALTLLNDELKTANALVKSQNADLEATFGAMSDGVTYYDREYRLVAANHRVAELTGVPADILRPGATLSEVLRAQAWAGEFGPLTDTVEIEAEVGRRLTSMALHPPNREIERTRPNGRTLALRLISRADGGFVTVYTDITAHKQVAQTLEAARQAAERTADEKARFAAIVSHEVRTPLNVIINALRLVDRTHLPAGQRMLVDTGLQASEALVGLLNDILDLSRLEGGHLTIVPAPFRPRELLVAIADMFRPLARIRGVELAVSVGSQVPADVVADAGRLRQIVMNLVSNAIKFADAGTVQLMADVMPGPAPSLWIAVQDNGPVIPAADRARLFRPFSQLSAASDVSAGSGLGLAICAMLAERMGGAASVSEATGAGGVAGNSFSVLVPLQAGPAGPAPPPPVGPPAARQPRVPRTRVLVVEDGDASRWLLATMLRGDGHAVDVAPSGEAALARLLTQPYDVVLADVSMPGMDGLELTRRIRDLPGPARTMPVVGVTAYTSAARRDDCLAAGMAGVVSKPVAAGSLRDALFRHVWRGPPPVSPSVLPPGLPPVSPPVSPPVPSRAEPVVFDPAWAQGLAGADQLARVCLHELTAQWAVLATAAAKGDADRIVAVAHAMMGAAGNHGFMALAHTLARLKEVTPTIGEAALLVATARLDILAASDAIARLVAGQGLDLVGATGIEPVTLRV